jgi:hypothetical protein
MTLQQVKEWAAKNRVTAIVIAAVVALVVAFGAGRMSVPSKVVKEVETKIQWQTKLEYRDVEVVKVQKEYVDRWNTQYATKAESDTECSEDFDKTTGKLYHRVCKTIKKTDTGASSSGSEQASSSGSSEHTNTGTSTSSGTATTKEKITTINNYENLRVALSLNTHWNQINLANPISNLKVGIEGDYRLFWKLWLGAHVVPGDKEFGLQLSLTH